MSAAVEHWIVDPFEQDGVDGEEVAGQNRVPCVTRNCFQVRPALRGAGSMPAWCRIFQTVLAAIW